MLEPNNHPKENARMEELRSFNILDTLPEKEYDDIVELAATICEVPVALISLIDEKRQWFKAKKGLEATETERNISFCGHAIQNHTEVFVVENAKEDDRFADNPLVTSGPKIGFYIGVPLVTENALPMGTLCVIDDQPRKLSEEKIKALKTLANSVVKMLELRKKTLALERLNHDLENKNKALEKFAYTTAHDLRSPLTGLVQLGGMLKTEVDQYQNKHISTILDLAVGGTKKLINLIDDLMTEHQEQITNNSAPQATHLPSLMNEVKGVFEFHLGVEFVISVPDISMSFPRLQVKQALINLVSNAIKHNRGKKLIIEVTVEQQDTQLNITVSDNGKGIDQSMKTQIFQLFNNSEEDKSNRNGFGLHYIKNLMIELGGDVVLINESSPGAHFEVSVPVYS